MLLVELMLNVFKERSDKTLITKHSKKDVFLIQIKMDPSINIRCAVKPFPSIAGLTTMLKLSF